MLKWSAAAVFTLNFFAIIPLAAVLAFATEALAADLGEALGGLLNATFGNAVELIVCSLLPNAHKAQLILPILPADNFIG